MDQFLKTSRCELSSFITFEPFLIKPPFDSNVLNHCLSAPYPSALLRCCVLYGCSGWTAAQYSWCTGAGWQHCRGLHLWSWLVSLSCYTTTSILGLLVKTQTRLFSSGVFSTRNTQMPAVLEILLQYLAWPSGGSVAAAECIITSLHSFCVL